MNDDEEWDIDGIYSSRWSVRGKKKSREFLIKWGQGYNETNTFQWVPPEQFNDKKLIDDFMETYEDLKMEVFVVMSNCTLPFIWYILTISSSLFTSGRKF